MKTSTLKCLRNGILFRISHRRCSSENIIQIVKSHQIKDENVFAKHKNKEFKILQQLGLKFNESTEENVEKKNKNFDGDLSLDTKYRVGHFPTQYPLIAHRNLCQFSKLFTPTNTAMDDWKINHAVKQMFPFSITSSIDYYPFSKTFCPKTKLWKISKEKEHCLIDCINDKNVPILTRKLNKKSVQKCVFFRDLHPNISSMDKMEQMIKTYKPNKIIFELSPDGGSAAIRSFQKYRFKYLILPFLKMSQQIIGKKFENQSKILQILRKYLCILPPSFGQICAMNIAINEQIPIVAADYCEKSMIGLLAFAECLDLYESVFLKRMNFPIDRLKKLMMSSDHLLTTKFLRLCAVRIQPHLYVIGSHRNDLMSLAINECDEERLLFVGGEAHCYDVVDRLCGKVKIENPFKEVKEQRVLLKEKNANHYSGHCDISVDDLENEDVEIAKKVLGADAFRTFTALSN